MCGRYAIFAAPHRLVELMDAVLKNGAAGAVGGVVTPNFPPRYNAAPMQDLPIVVKGKNTPGKMGLARWGLLPPWANADDRGLCAKMINARAETVAEKPAFRAAWEKGRRCLIPANGFYEWKEGGDAGVKTGKQPYFLHHQQEEVIVFAGLWAKFGDLVTFTILTKEASGAIADIHHRMPVIFTPDQAPKWFAADETGAFEMIAAAQGQGMGYYPVGRAVGRVAEDHEGLVARVDLGAPDAQTPGKEPGGAQGRLL